MFRGRTLSELLSRPQADRLVVRGGAATRATVPDYSELDDVAGAHLAAAAPPAAAEQRRREQEQAQGQGAAAAPPASGAA